MYGISRGACGEGGYNSNRHHHHYQSHQRFYDEANERFEIVLVKIIGEKSRVVRARGKYYHHHHHHITTTTTVASKNNTDEKNTSDVPSMTIRDEKELSESQEISLIDVTGKSSLNSDISDSSKEINEQESSISSSKKDDKSSTSKNIDGDDIDLECKKNINEEIIVDEATVNTEQPVATTYLNKSRKNIEVVYDKATILQNKKIRPTLVEIDEDGEKMILDSSEENYSFCFIS
ncbi:hypothetical protein M0804_008020 [Polistes exclamans]|nr:hypothetical protein M0804_008020 [Polistes exclamans]